MRVALAEDGALFREGLQMLLQAAGHEVVAVAAGGDELRELLATTPADVAVLDIRMPPEPDGGLTTAERLREVNPDMGLLFLSHYAESHYLMRILRIGTESIGYRLKEKVGSVEALSDTLARIEAGRSSSSRCWRSGWSTGRGRSARTPSRRCRSGSSTCYASWRRAARTGASPHSCS